MKKLVDMRRIKIIHKPKYAHSSTKEDYDIIQNDVNCNLDFIGVELEKHNNKVKNRIINISIKEIKRVFTHYFNVFVNSKNNEVNRVFSQNYEEIKNIVGRTQNLEVGKKNKIYEKLTDLKNKFTIQLRTIKKLEEDIVSGKIKPRKNLTEILKLK